MKGIKFIALISIVLCLLIVIPTGFAVDDGAVNETVASDDSEILSDDIYFDSDSADEGNGSADNPYGDFTNDRIQNNSVIHFASGEYNLSNDSYCSDVSFYGEDSQNTILNGNGYTLYGNNHLSFKNITLINIKIVTDSGFNLSATNTVFKDCGDEDSKGGAIYSQHSGSITLTNSSFYNNFASYGGAIYMSKGSMYIYNSTFEDNSAIYGGAIFVNESVLEIYNSTFKNNVALMSGGAITSLYGSSLINNKSSFYKNNAGFEGGAIYSVYGTSSVFKSSFANNSAAAGGALFIDNTTSVSISGNEFVNNSASMAGAIYSLANSISTILNNDYSGNSAIVNNDLLETVTPYLFIGNGNYEMYLYNSSYTGELPSSYDLRYYNLTTPVKQQGSGGNCWSFSAMAALESAILKATGITYDLSEENMKNLMSWYSDYGWNMQPNKGGYDDMAVGYLISWLGPVFESQDSYNPQSTLSLILNGFTHIQNVAYLTRSSYTDNDLIKKAILEYGAVSSSIRWNDASINKKLNSRYYNGHSGADHAVAIVGWDDNYPKNNFAITPPGDGAWIIKNSHGTESGDNGYWYVSYYDVRLAQPGKKDTTYVFIFNDTLKFDKNYQYDIPGKTDFFINSSSTVWYKNIFNATGNEYLAAVSTFFNGDTNYTVSVLVNGALKLTQSGFAKEGYWTINLNEFIPLEVGDIFEVIFKITVDGEAGIPISERYKRDQDGNWINNMNNIFVKENISFLSYDGEKWTDLFNLSWKYSSHNYLSQVACIKAFTVFDEVNTTIELRLTNITNGYNVQATVLNQYNRPVTSGIVTFSIDGKNFVATVHNGIAECNFLFDAGNYNLSAEFNAVGYVSSQNKIPVNVSSINTTTSLVVLNEYDLVDIIANVTNQYGYSVNVGKVTFTVDGNDIYVDVIDGIARLSYNFKNLGFNNISAKFNGIYYYGLSKTVSNVTVKSTIISNDATKTFNSQYSFTLLDSYGNPLSKKAVKVTIGSNNYDATTDENGVVNINIALNPGTYSAIITNPINNESKTQNINVVKRITENSAVTMYYGAGKYYKVKVFDDNGNIAKGASVTFKINGKSYTRTVDSNGYASFKISLKPGTYTITAEYKGFKVSNKIKVKTTIVTKNIKVKKGKTIKFKAKLLNKNGKILKNKKIKFKFKGKTYKVKTSKKGIATLKITKKYKVGKYTIKTTYGKLTVKNTIKIRK